MGPLKENWIDSDELKNWSEKRNNSTSEFATPFRIETVAEGQAGWVRTEGMAESELNQVTASLEGRIMHKKTDSRSDYNQAAITKRFIPFLPLVAQTLADPLFRIGKKKSCSCFTLQFNIPGGKNLYAEYARR